MIYSLQEKVNDSTCEAVVAWINIHRSFYNYSIVLNFIYVDTVNK